MDVGSAPSSGAPPTSGGSSALVRTAVAVPGGDVEPPPSAYTVGPRGASRWADDISRTTGIVGDDENDSQFSEASWASRSVEELLNIVNSVFDPTLEDLASYEERVIRAVAILEHLQHLRSQRMPQP